MNGSSAPALTLACMLAFALPAWAQDEIAAEPSPAEEPAAVVVPAEEAAPAEAESTEAAPVEEAPTETAAAEEAPAEEAPAEEPADPLQVYFGADWVVTTVALSNTLASGTTNEFDSGMYRGRLGIRTLESVGLEAHFGVDNSDDEPGSVETKGYYGLFLVPTATVFEIAELAFPVGFAQSTFGAGSAEQDFRSIAYGVDAELPLRSFGDGLPDVRFTAGWMVYYQKSDARAYGANVGLRYDFTTAANPFAGLGSAIGGLWPFGGGEETPAE
jgi:hypothetical protein